MNKEIKALKKERIDLYLVAVLDETRSQIQAKIKKNLILVNNNQVKPNFVLNIGDLITIKEEEKIDYLKAINLDLEVIYEDNYLAVINKPQGLITHPGHSYQGITLINGLKYLFPKLSNFENDPLRPGVVHRLDKETSGIMIIAKDEEAHKLLKEAFQRRKIQKVYEAIVHKPFLETTFTIDLPIKRHELKRQKMAVNLEGRKALTKGFLISQTDKYSYLKLELITGRTHQLRVHLSYIGHPILGDEIYGFKKDTNRLYLHAKAITFNHPITKKELSFETKLPNYFIEKLNELRLI